MEHRTSIQPGADPENAMRGADVTDSSGKHATLTSIEHAGDESMAVLRTEHGREIMLPIGMLERQESGAYRIPFEYGAVSNEDGASNTIVRIIPVLQEELQIGKRVVETGTGVRLHKTVHEREQTVDMPLLQDELVVEHIAVDRLVENGQQPKTRYDGDTLIVPVLEEVLVVEKRVRLKEEIRITLHRHEKHAQQKVKLKSEEISVEAFDEKQGPSQASH